MMLLVTVLHPHGIEDKIAHNIEILLKTYTHKVISYMTKNILHGDTALLYKRCQQCTIIVVSCGLVCLWH